MKDGIIRRAVKRVALAAYMTDLRITRAVQDKPLYRLCGSCNHCGACCETPMIPIWPKFFYFRTIRWLIKAWHRVVNGFEFLHDDRRLKIFVFRCTHWDPVAKRCDSYDSRPGMCRDYPRNLIYAANPEFIAACGYYAIDHNAAALERSLNELDLPPDTLAEVKAKLYVAQPAPK